jgi:hypothetical protein
VNGHPVPATRRNINGCRAALTACAFAMFTAANAAEWYLEPLVRAGYERRTNLTLTTGPHETVSNSVFEPQLIAGIREESWDVFLDGRYRFLRYSQENLDTEQYFLRLAGQLRTERSIWQINTERNDDDTVTGNVLSPDVGVSDIRTDRRTQRIAPAWTGLITDRTRVRLGLSGSDVRYTDGVSVGLYDYRQRVASASLIRQLTEKDQVSLDLSASDYSTESLDFTSDTTSVSLGWIRAFTPTINGEFSYGWYRTESAQEGCILLFGTTCLRFGEVTAENTGNTYSFNLNKLLERGRLGLNARLSVDPTGSGTEVETDAVGVNGEYRYMNQRLIASLVIDGVRARAVGGIRASSVDRDSYRIEPRLTWHWTTDLRLEAAYRRSWIQYVDATEAATDNAVFLTLSYRLPRLSASR